MKVVMSKFCQLTEDLPLEIFSRGWKLLLEHLTKIVYHKRDMVEMHSFFH